MNKKPKNKKREVCKYFKSNLIFNFQGESKEFFFLDYLYMDRLVVFLGLHYGKS
jgi:hypothetical protein